MTDSDCVLCAAQSEDYRRIASNNKAFCIVNIEPINDGHVMVLPKRHVELLDDLAPEEVKDMMTLIRQIVDAIRSTCRQDPLIIMNTGKHMSQAHLHFHVLPSQHPLRGLNFSIDKPLPKRKRASEEKLEAIRDLLA